MPDPLDPVDAFYGAFTDSFKRILAFLAVGMGGDFMAEQIHQTPTRLAGLQTGGISTIVSWFDINVFMVPFNWVATLIGSLQGWTILYYFIFIALVVALRRGSDLFLILLALGLTQPIDSFFVRQRYSPLSGGDLGLAIGLLIVLDIGLAALLFWWRHTGEEATGESPAPEPKELEL